jgi:predicted RNase H-like nuclease (RuvC/YqgF family)
MRLRASDDDVIIFQSQQLERQNERQEREINQLQRRLQRLDQRLDQRLRDVERNCCGELDPPNDESSDE